MFLFVLVQILNAEVICYNEPFRSGSQCCGMFDNFTKTLDIVATTVTFSGRIILFVILMLWPTCSMIVSPVLEWGFTLVKKIYRHVESSQLVLIYFIYLFINSVWSVFLFIIFLIIRILFYIICIKCFELQNYMNDNVYFFSCSSSHVDLPIAK